MTSLKVYYREQSDRLSSEIARLKQRNRYYVAGEILSFLVAVAWVALFTTHIGAAWMLWTAVATAVLYVAIRRADETNSVHIDNLKARKRVYDHELNYLEGDFSCFDTGIRYSDSQQPFSYDLDIFGPQSLFNRIDRTLTSGGSDYLASCLSSLTLTRDETERRRKAVWTLAEHKDWRERYLACGADEKIDTRRVASALDKLKALRLDGLVTSSAMPYVAWGALGVLVGLSLVSAFTSLPASVPVLWAIGQLLFVCLFCRGTLEKISRTVDETSGQMEAYARIVGMIGRLRGMVDESEELQALVEKVGEAEAGFTAFSKILSSLDRCNSFMGQVLYSIMFMTVFLIHRFLRWYRTYSEGMADWIAAIDRLDAIVSMATFRNNEPASTAAEITDAADVVYEARALYHPFLGERAVRNDFSILDRNYYIVTGANMAGKSTFLRSLGINYILARNGMPVFAEHLKVSVFSLFSSMRTTDDLAHGISYFNAELLRLKQLIAYCKTQPRTLIILDEILKGTNSLDKLNGSRLFLEYISQLPVSGIIATHDLELSKMETRADGRFHNYCFEIELSDRVTYSYKITQGVARNQNATFLLKQILDE